MSLRLVLICACCLLVLSALRAQDPAPASGVPEKVAAALAGIKANDLPSVVAAENALVAEGADALPAVREALAKEREALAKLADLTGDDAAMCRGRIDALDSAIVRLTWHWDPRAEIARWLRRQKDTNGDPFTTEARPLRVADDALARAFPHLVFYTIQFAPADTLPAVLKTRTLFTLNKDGLLTHLPTSEALEKQFRKELPPVSTEDEERVQDIMVAWLRLSEAFALDDTTRVTIPTDSVKANYKGAGSTAGWRVSGKAVVEPKGGDLLVEMAFDALGQLKTLTETRTTPAPEAAP